MLRFRRAMTLLASVSTGVAALAGCGSTRTSYTARTATEQLLVSDAIDRTVQSIDFSPLKDQAVYMDESRLGDVVDKNYLISTLRQHMLASGCVLMDARDKATFVVEARSGGVGTDNDDLLFGVPAVNVPQVPLAPALPAAIPEIPFAKRRYQRGVAKVAVFAYRRETGEPVWQSGIVTSDSTANDIWVLGAGPFKRGTVYDGQKFAGSRLKKKRLAAPEDNYLTSIRDKAVFDGIRPDEPAKPAGDAGVMQASAEVAAAPAAAPPPATTDGPPVLPPPLPLSQAPPAEPAG